MNIPKKTREALIDLLVVECSITDVFAKNGIAWEEDAAELSDCVIMAAILKILELPPDDELLGLGAEHDMTRRKAARIIDRLIKMDERRFEFKEHRALTHRP